MIFVVKNPSKRSVSLKKNGWEEKNVKRNVKKLYFKDVLSQVEYIRRVEDEKSSPKVGRPFL
jgi:hypothetical protein